MGCGQHATTVDGRDGKACKEWDGGVRCQNTDQVVKPLTLTMVIGWTVSGIIGFGATRSLLAGDSLMFACLPLNR